MTLTNNYVDGTVAEEKGRRGVRRMEEGGKEEGNGEEITDGEMAVR